jgi:hypothetical protein
LGENGADNQSTIWANGWRHRAALRRQDSRYEGPVEARRTIALCASALGKLMK